MDIERMRKEFEKIKAAKKKAKESNYNYVAECGKIVTVTIKGGLGKDKELQRGSEDFNKLEKMILSDEHNRDAIERNGTVYGVCNNGQLVVITGYEDLI